MIKIVESKANQVLYTSRIGDSLESIAMHFSVNVESILRDNPLFSTLYPGCVLLITGIGQKRVVVRPLQTLDEIAKENGVSKQNLMKRNNLTSEKVFVGMPLYIDKE